MNDAIEEGGKPALVLGEVKRFRKTSVSASGLDQNEMVHQLIKLDQADLQQIELIEEHETVEQRRARYL